MKCVKTVCVEPGCESSGRKIRGMCIRHYNQWRRKHGKYKCTKADCELPAHGKGLCINHYMQTKKYVHIRTPTPAVCSGCGVTYQRSTKNKRKYCTYRCAMRHRAPANKKTQELVPYVRPPRKRPPIATQPGYNRTFKSVLCRVCAHWFVTLNVERTCSDACLKVDTRNNHRIHGDRRRARKKAAYVANVYRKKVWALDSYRCHLCGKKTDPTKQVPHPKAPTLDHVIPLARGGTHEPANCRTACFLCNSTKGDRGGGEQFTLDIA